MRVAIGVLGVVLLVLAGVGGTLITQELVSGRSANCRAISGRLDERAQSNISASKDGVDYLNALADLRQKVC